MATNDTTTDAAKGSGVADTATVNDSLNAKLGEVLAGVGGMGKSIDTLNANLKNSISQSIEDAFRTSVGKILGDCIYDAYMDAMDERDEKAAHESAQQSMMAQHNEVSGRDSGPTRGSAEYRAQLFNVNRASGMEKMAGSMFNFTDKFGKWMEKQDKVDMKGADGRTRGEKFADAIGAGGIYRYFANRDQRKLDKMDKKDRNNAARENTIAQRIMAKAQVARSKGDMDKFAKLLAESRKHSAESKKYTDNIRERHAVPADGPSTEQKITDSLTKVMNSILGNGIKAPESQAPVPAPAVAPVARGNVIDAEIVPNVRGQISAPVEDKDDAEDRDAEARLREDKENAKADHAREGTAKFQQDVLKKLDEISMSAAGGDKGSILGSMFRMKWLKNIGRATKKVKQAGAFLKSLPGKIKNGVKGVVAKLKKLPGAIARGFNKVKQIIKDMPGNVIGGVRRVASVIKGIPGMLMSGLSKVKGMITGIPGKLLSGMKEAAGFILSIPTKLKAALAAMPLIGKFFKGGADDAAETGAKAVAKEGAKDAGKTAAKEGGKVAAKAGAKTGLKTVVKKLPIIGALAGAAFAVDRFMDGDIVGGIGELASGAASLIPAVGTGVSMAIDGALIARDVYKSSNPGAVEGAVNTPKPAAGAVTPNPNSTAVTPGHNVDLKAVPAEKDTLSERGMISALTSQEYIDSQSEIMRNAMREVDTRLSGGV